MKFDINWINKNKILLLIVLVVLIVPALYLAWVFNIHNPSVYGDPLPIVKVGGDSMKPTYLNGEWLILYMNDKIQIMNNSVVVYKKALSGSYVVHRIVKINEDGTYITKGDHLDLTDQELKINSRNVTREDIYGVVAGKLL
jgi:signal peptidase I